MKPADKKLLLIILQSIFLALGVATLMGTVWPPVDFYYWRAWLTIALQFTVTQFAGFVLYYTVTSTMIYYAKLDEPGQQRFITLAFSLVVFGIICSLLGSFLPRPPVRVYYFEDMFLRSLP